MAELKKNTEMTKKQLRNYLITADAVLAFIIGVIILPLIFPAVGYCKNKLLAHLGNADAQYNLSFLSILYPGYPDFPFLDRSEELHWLRKAAEKGHVYAQCRLADSLFAEKEFKEAVQWYRKGAEQGNEYCRRQLALCYTYGCGVPKDLKQAVECYRQGADKGEPESIYQLALCYKYGNGVPKDPKQAVSLFRQGAEKNDISCVYHLALCYKYGDGVPKDPKQAVKWFRVGADIKLDTKDMAKWMRTGGTGISCVDCQYQLAQCFLHGYGVNKDLQQAVSLFKKAAGAGHVRAQYSLGRCLELGQGVVNKDPGEAAVWYRKAAKQGHRGAEKALNNLSVKKH